MNHISNPLEKIPFAQRVILFAAKGPDHLATLGTVTNVWNETVCDYPHTWNSVEKDPLSLPIALIFGTGNAKVNKSLGNTNLYERLIKARNDHNINSNSFGLFCGMTFLHLAINRGEAAVVKVLIDANAKLNKKDGSRNTPLHFAITEDQGEIVKILIDAGAVLDAKEDCTFAPLHLAVDKRKINVIRTLLEIGANQEKRNNAGDTPLHMAVNNGDGEILKIFIEANANLEVRNNDGDTPLHMAVNNGSGKIVKILIDGDVNLNATNSSGNTPLHCLAFKSTEITPVLPELRIRGIICSITIPLNNFLKVAKILIDANAELNPLNRDGVTPLHIAAHHGEPEMVQIFVEAGAILKLDSHSNKDSRYGRCVIA